MNPEDLPEQTDTQEHDRAAKLSQLYPQPEAYSRSFTHTPQVSPATDLSGPSAVNSTRLLLVGAATSLPFLAFEVGRSTLAGTETVTEVSQMGMLSLLYLVLVTGLILLTCKLFIKNNQITTIRPFFAYCMVLLFSIPTTLLLKDIFPSVASTTATAPMYYMIIVVTFAAATLLFAKLKRKISLILLSVPFFIGAVRAAFDIFK